jgi:hypothetical protein
VRTLLACLVALTLSSCGADPGEPAADDEWTQQRIEASSGADSPTGFASDGDDVLVVVVGEDAALQSYLSTDGGAFRAGDPIEIEGGGHPSCSDPVRHDGVWWLIGTGGLVGKGKDETLAFEPRVLRSSDGLTWEPVDVTGIPGPVDLNAVAVVDGTLVAVGSKRNGVDTGGASFEAAVWRSDDGASWTEVALPGVVPQPDYRDESVAAHVTTSDGRVLAGGSLAQRAAIWSSTDGGVTWSRIESVDVEELYQVSGLVADGSTVLVSGSVKGQESGSRLLRSDDGGATYQPSADQPAADGEGFAPLWTGGGHWFTVSRPGYDTVGDPAVCYADPDACFYGGESDVTLVNASDDGEAWSVLALPDPDLGADLIGVAGTGSGDVLLAHVVSGGIVVSSWPAGTQLPEGEAPAAPERVDLVTVPEGEDPEPGVRYHAPLYIHCGMDWLYLGDTPWQRTDSGPDVETGAGDDPSEGWPMAGQTVYGFATLTDGAVVEYSIGEGADAEVIATYEKTGVQPPGCD